MENGPIYEVVTGQILLSKRSEFFRLHDEVLLPMMAECGIKPMLLLLTDIGRYGRFLDIYQFRDLSHYETATNLLLDNPGMPDYHKQIGACIDGTFTVELMRDFPYAARWTR